MVEATPHTHNYGYGHCYSNRDREAMGFPGFTGGLAIVGLLGAAYVLYRRG